MLFRPEYCAIVFSIVKIYSIRLYNQFTITDNVKKALIHVQNEQRHQPSIDAWS